MIEKDLLLMTLVIFVPAVAALPLCVRWIFPRGSEEWMRWWALFWTAVTLVISMVIFIDYYTMTDRQEKESLSGHNRLTLLGSRADQAWLTS